MAKRKMSTEEKLKIIEKDPILWLKNFVKIINNDGEVIPFEVNKEQENFIKNMEKYNIISKSRQLGFTTLSLGLMLYYASTMPNTNYLMLSYDDTSVKNIFENLKRMYDSIPQQYKVKEKRNNRDELVLENGSRIAVKVAGIKEIGRSFTCQLIHCSEFAFWNDYQQEKGLLALEQALAKNPNSKLIIESTSNGIGNNFYNLFMSAYRGRSKYKAFFYGWYGNKKQFKHEYDIAEQWYKSINGGKRLSNSPYELDDYERKLLEKGATLKQLMWRRWKLLDISLDDFKQEFPSFPEESFISTGNSVFNPKTITERYNYLFNPLGRKELIDLPKSLIPYINNGLYIYKDRKRNEKYFGGVDVASGLGGNNDYSAVNILDSSGEQVATFYRNDLPVYKFVKLVYDLGHYFNYCMYLIERNSYGLDLIHRLRKEMLYIQVLKVKKFDKAKGQKVWEYGWYTDNVNKTKLINDLKEVFDEGIILVNDRETLDEMKIFVDTNGKLGNERGNGKHDDLVISLGLAVQCLKAGRWYV